ncbi:peptide chain release factor N(5)-glutamine methyltransferase [Psychrobacillus sp. INOP01]|uniref:peptide chain release factor N(5)-glutamine methyltransferase n=1 Tax=Psychrobacillus sp. INOP01 TaxID=2829187 RepID=UPI001BACD709|nr:peptide chain release factor N(5)-glutamine methyltransferase [Psychrobacillus sp. INOP01]QUG40488.1 peptide chain release factor N(5)-glutamine methyltransferase [Psychrobacillus sp. INOP01]
MCKTNFEALTRASSFLAENNREKEVARYLLQHVLKKNYSELMMTIYDEITPEAYQTFWAYVEEHATGRPFQYIIGQESFYGRDFLVNEHVLIPRPETEELIEEVKKRAGKLFEEYNSIKIADIGTGSGAIALTIKNEILNVWVTATDISSEALIVAKKNAERLEVKVEFKQGDLLAPIADQKWDIILSNPPYIGSHEAENMSDTVIDYEPHLALFAEEDGLQLYRKMAEQLPGMMNTPSLIGFEIGYAQGPAVQKMLQNAFPLALVEVVQDINQKNRFVFCTIK